METDVPGPERGITDGIHIVSYVADELGKQGPVPGSVWFPVNVVNRQAWEEIEKRIEFSKSRIRSGRASCLHYYMTANQMDIGLLARYAGFSRWLVRLHLIPFFFRRLGAETLSRYAEIFQISVNDLSAGRLLPAVYNRHEAVVQTDE